MTAKIQVYLTTTCPFCVAATQLLRDRGLDYEPIVLDQHPDRRGATDAILPGHKTVPLVVIDGKPIGGFRELTTLDESGELQRLK